MKTYTLAFLALAACGDDGGSTVDAAKTFMDAPSGKVQAVTCPASPDATIITTNTVDAYMPNAVTIPVNGVVKFALSSFHDVNPNTITTTDPALVVGFGGTKCFKFTQAQTYGIFCSAHSFTGTITVQ